MDWMLFLTFLAATFAAAATGAMFQPGAWYDRLRKPAWTPPPIVFPIAWTTLYLLMSWAALRVALLPGSGQALAFWSVQIALNTLWTPVFFGLRRMRAAMVVIVALWLAVATTAWAFARLDGWAGAAMLPYLLWVTIASALNWSVWRMNPAEDAALRA